MSSATNRRNILQLIRDRELNDHIRTKYELKSNLYYKCISKLGLLAQLEGHQGCVNCLQWNLNGSTLASASDDYQVILWDPFLQKVKTTIKTLHRGNIFSVKFIPNCNDDIIATGAGDWSSHTYNVTTGQKLSSCSCSHGRIKRLAVANDTPSVYWSASEDGCISQHDMRMSHECPTEKSKITLVSLYGHLGKKIEAKCLDINQLKTEQLAVGANDQYARLYDRRMIRSLSSFTVKHSVLNNSSEFDFVCTDNSATETLNTFQSALQYYVPGHIHPYTEILPQKQRNFVITYLTFSPDGQELLVNYGGDYVYLYNLMDQTDNAFFNVPKVMKVPRGHGEGFSLDITDDPVPVPHLALPDKVEKLKLKANYLFENQEFTAAIYTYNEAIDIYKCSILFSNRAAAYIKRNWYGDYYAGLKDCVTALKLDPNNMKAHFRLTVCLCELGMLKDSRMYLEQFTINHPSYKNSPAIKGLLNNLRNEEVRNKERLRNRRPNFHEVLHMEQTEKKDFEKYFSSRSKDYLHRYYGHCNTSTDIKEANFFGNQNQFIVAGSDDGLFFVWDKHSENNLLLLKGDSSIVNCVQPHPSEFMLATSGIDNEVKLWSPLSDDVDNAFKVENFKKTARINQRRMTADPIELIMRNMRRDALEGNESSEFATIRDEYGVDPLSDDFDCRMS